MKEVEVIFRVILWKDFFFFSSSFLVGQRCVVSVFSMKMVLGVPVINIRIKSKC